MNKTILKATNNQRFPFDWINLDYYPSSNGRRVELYILKEDRVLDELIIMFHTLFKDNTSNIKVYNSSWWDFCLDSWEPNTEIYNYELEGKVEESQAYLTLLVDSNIPNGYSGSCECTDWNKFLTVILNCILSHQAPFSPIFYDKTNNYFFYFHHSGSIGFYYQHKSILISNLLEKASKYYNLIEG